MFSVPLTLAQTTAAIALAVIVGAALGAFGAWGVIRLVSGSVIKDAKSEAERLLERSREDARSEAERIRLAGEKEVLERSRKFEEESEQTRRDLKEFEKRLTKREDLLDRKLDTLAVKEENLAKEAHRLDSKRGRIESREQELEELVRQRTDELTQVAHMSREEAKEELLKAVEEDARHDAAKIVRRITEEAEDQGKDRAREITLQAIQRYAAEHTAESTVRAVPLPSDDMKGRVIGREGRNIRAMERATGVDIIVDDTPGLIVVSSFDKIRQTIAAEALTKLVNDGRVHPARIEEVVSQVRKDIEAQIVKTGKEAVMEVNLRGVHPKVAEAMGKLHFRTSHGQNVLRHSIEVAYLSQMIATQLGLKGALARRCGFLHDIGKAMDHDVEGTHPQIGMDFAKQHGERDPVLNAIGGHHGDIPSKSFYTPIVMAADTLSGSRPGARRESFEKYIQRLEQLQDIARSYNGVKEAYAIQAGREVRVMVDAKQLGDDEASYLARQIADRVSDEMTFPGEVRVTVLRETRAVEIAK